MSDSVTYRKLVFQQSVSPIRDKVEELKTKEQTLLRQITLKPEEAPLIRLSIADELLNLTLLQLKIDLVYRNLFKNKNDDVLDDSRKYLLKCIVNLEETVSGHLDVPFSEYEEKLEKILSFNADSRYKFIYRIDKTINMLKNAYGLNTKWKWFFVELEGRFAVVVKNFLSFKVVHANNDPGSPDYEPITKHLRMAKELLNRSAYSYREKYEMASKHISDFKKGVDFLGSLYRIHTLLREKDEAEDVKKKLKAWTAKLHNDTKHSKVRHH